MANTKSAKKTIRKIAKRSEVNAARRGRMRSFIRKVEQAIGAGDKKIAMDTFRMAQPEIMRAAHKGIIHKNTAARKISRLCARVKVMSA